MNKNTTAAPDELQKPAPVVVPTNMVPAKQTTHKCPICDVLMVAMPGSRLDATDGVTIWCANTHGSAPGNCTAQEVFGHANNEKAAYEIVKDKYKKSA